MTDSFFEEQDADREGHNEVELRRLSGFALREHSAWRSDRSTEPIKQQKQQKQQQKQQQQQQQQQQHKSGHRLSSCIALRNQDLPVFFRNAPQRSVASASSPTGRQDANRQGVEQDYLDDSSDDSEDRTLHANWDHHLRLAEAEWQRADRRASLTQHSLWRFRREWSKEEKKLEAEVQQAKTEFEIAEQRAACSLTLADSPSKTRNTLEMLREARQQALLDEVSMSEMLQRLSENCAVEILELDRLATESSALDTQRMDTDRAVCECWNMMTQEMAEAQELATAMEATQIQPRTMMPESVHLRTTAATNEHQVQWPGAPGAAGVKWADANCCQGASSSFTMTGFGRREFGTIKKCLEMQRSCNAELGESVSCRRFLLTQAGPPLDAMRKTANVVDCRKRACQQVVAGSSNAAALNSAAEHLKRAVCIACDSCAEQAAAVCKAQIAHDEVQFHLWSTMACESQIQDDPSMVHQQAAAHRYRCTAEAKMQSMATSLQTWSGLMVPNQTATSTKAISLEPWDTEGRKVHLRLRCAEAEETSLLHRLEVDEMNEATRALSEMQASSKKLDTLRQFLQVPGNLGTDDNTRFVSTALTEELEMVTARCLEACDALDVGHKEESELEVQLQCFTDRLCSCEQRELDIATVESQIAEQSSAQVRKGRELQEIYALRAEDVERCCIAQQTVLHHCREIDASFTSLRQREESVQQTLEKLRKHHLDEVSAAEVESNELLLYQQRAEEGVCLANMEASVVELSHRAIGCKAACSLAFQRCAALEMQLQETCRPVAGRWQRRKLSREARILSPLPCHELDAEERVQGHSACHVSVTAAAEGLSEECRSVNCLLAELESLHVKLLHVAANGSTSPQQKQQPEQQQQQKQQQQQQKQFGTVTEMTSSLVGDSHSVGSTTVPCMNEERDFQISISMEQLTAECNELQAQLRLIDTELSMASLELLEMKPQQGAEADLPPPPINQTSRAHGATTADDSSKLQALFELRIKQLMQADAVNAEEELLCCQERCAVEALEYELEKAEKQSCPEMGTDEGMRCFLPGHVDIAHANEVPSMHSRFLDNTDNLLKQTRMVMQEATGFSAEQQVLLNEVLRERDELQRRFADALNCLNNAP